MSGKLTHFDASGQAHMVDVSEKGGARPGWRWPRAMCA